MEPTRDVVPDCTPFRSELPAYLYGEIVPEAGVALERHVDGCAACREELATLKETRGALDRWIVPSDGADSVQLARSIRSAAGEPPPLVAVAPRRRARLTRLSARLMGAAAGLIFALCLFSTEASVEAGRLDLSFALPGLQREPDVAPTSEPRALDDHLRAIAAQEVSTRAASMQRSQLELSRMTREELIQEVYRLSQAVDQARAQDKQALDARLEELQRLLESNDLAQRRAIQDIAKSISPYIRPASNR